MDIRVAGPELWSQISEGVLDLLRELGEKAAGSGNFDSARFESLWREDPDRLRAIVAFDRDGRLAAVATLIESFAIYANGRYGILLEMYVAPAHRSNGLGAQLLQRAVEYGTSRGWSRIEVTAPEGARWARTVAFYLRNGFRHTGPKLKILLDNQVTQAHGEALIDQ
jgi:GNAT superfamily N-acetyltransferase